MAKDSDPPHEASSTAHIVQSLLVNVGIAVMKGVAAFFTGSGAMLAEALHSASDCMNQVLLLVGVKQARRKPDAEHPLGYGRAVYFWSFLVALMLFCGGGVFSIYEGLHKIENPEPVERVWLGVVILFGSLLMEGGALASNVKELHARRGKIPFFEYLRKTKDADLVVVFGENAAAVLGLAFAMAALLLAWKTGDGRWDGLGSAMVGLVLVGVAAFLAREVKSLLLGESADPDVDAAVHAAVADTPEFARVLHVVTVQQGPGEVMVAVKVSLVDALSADTACRAINEFEARLRGRRPEVRWLFVEPDLPRDA